MSRQIGLFVGAPVVSLVHLPGLAQVVCWLSTVAAAVYMHIRSCERDERIAAIRADAKAVATERTHEPKRRRRKTNRET
ncbi:hypothetical protein SAMN04487968_11721 [Nocardioides terrae]|uniref:Uncharacterized protein n=2 Tax=Nocardioides terrae TaxID=574651 RepID=A0A1I1NHB1_9ACTN|nr:hypothetical protein SAMN04487968_11721 [Nocardioides terrae]